MSLFTIIGSTVVNIQDHHIHHYTSLTLQQIMSTVVYSGYLTKRGHNFPTWKKRFFEITTDGELSYFTSEGGLKKGSFQFNKWTVIAPSSFFDTDEYGITLRGNMTCLYIKVATEEEKDKWVHELHQVLNRIKEMDSAGVRDQIEASRSVTLGEVDTPREKCYSQDSLLEMSRYNSTDRAHSTSS